jgi:hypothetical protein
MNQGETVTMFNDMCLLAPAALLDVAVVWEEIGSQRVRGAFTNAGFDLREIEYDSSVPLPTPITSPGERTDSGTRSH